MCTQEAASRFHCDVDRPKRNEQTLHIKADLTRKVPLQLFGVKVPKKSGGLQLTFFNILLLKFASHKVLN